LCPGDCLSHERLVLGFQAVATLLLGELESLRERVVLSGEISSDVSSTALHKVLGKLATGSLVDAVFLGKADEGWIEQANERPEGPTVARVRGGCDEQEVAVLRVAATYGKLLKKLMALVSASARIGISRAGVRLVDDYQLGGGADELVPTSIALYEVGRDDRVWEDIEDGLVRSAVTPFEAASRAGQNQLGVKVELLRQLPLPLLGEVRGAKHREARDGSVVEQFSDDQSLKGP
jgi:hypothetical protein